ncbi:MAG: hypothetical protein ACI9R3_004803, partial [Verrucomicrobiales bacterium]
GRDKPIVLRLKGNCLRDLAGCSVVFDNSQPETEELTEVLFDEQEGLVGDMTASRRAKIPTVTEVELQELLRNRKPVPSVTANTLYLEWFSERNGRVVIETSNCRVIVSEPTWDMSADEERVQEAESQQNFYAFLDKITGSIHAQPEEDLFPGEESNSETESSTSEDPFFFLDSPGPLREGAHQNDSGTEDDEPTSYDESMQPLDEFEWEHELREADRKAAAYQEALEKYKDTPDRDKRMAEAMGWDDNEDIDADFDWEDIQFADDDDAIEGESPADDESELEIDEMHHHPLSKRVTDLALHLQRDAEVRGLLAKHDPAGGVSQVASNPYLSVVMHIIALGGKLAAALDGSAQGIDPEPGFVIAMLKRAQIPLNEAMHAMGSLFPDHLDENTAEWLEFARTELFELRNDILEIMQDLRTRRNR